jgi:phosphoribosylaminoimidazolecarboxamide formyltransferase/IMP cyclohydrolase
VDLGRRLAKLGVEILSTGGTSRSLREAGLTVRDVSDFTGFPEMLDGRVKTLHPRVHGGILGRPTPEHEKQMKEHKIDRIDLVVVNLYPFRETVARGAAFDEVIENIDIGGPAMVRSAAKNHERVAVVVDPKDYDRVLGEIESKGQVSGELRFELCRKAFAHTAAYDGAIASHLGRPPCTPRCTWSACSATARTRTRRPPSIPGTRLPECRWPRPRSCKARNFPTTTCSTSTPP